MRKVTILRFNEQILYNDNNSAIIKTFHSIVSPARRFYNEHHHTECELSLFISGSGVYKTRNKEYSFKQGDIFLFGSNETHCITEIHEELNLLNMHFEPRILWENPENIELMKLFVSRNKNFENKYTDKILQNAILEIEREISFRKVGYKMQAKHCLLSALLHILREYDYVTDSNSFSFQKISTIEKIKDAISYIDNNLEKKITLKDIADIAYMSQSHFSALFKKFNGVSPWDYITIKRVEKAITLLKTTNLSKLEIASQCGFSSHSNFYKMFSQITGKTPSEYSKLLNAK